MKVFYQTEWQGIKFSDFCETVSTRLADSSFYDSFYRELFTKYESYRELDFEWRRNKDEIVNWLSEVLPDGGKILSVGCGLGYMESRIWSKYYDHIELHVQDYASEALRWLRLVMPSDRIHDADGQMTHTQHELYDLIYLSAVDYALPDNELIQLLIKLREHLRKDGQVLIISASFLDESFSENIIRSVKDVLKSLLEVVGLYSRGQFWGWQRSRLEYQYNMRAAGFLSLTDGFIETPHQRTYWIKGSV